jgi:hypothetical protein
VVCAGPDWPRHDVPPGPGGEKTWKTIVHAAVADAPPLSDGPVGMQIALTVGPGRRWTGMWKRTIDGLDPLLGSAYTDRPWNPLDGRIVRLGLHRADDPSLGNDVRATIWACAAESTWPEVDWLARLSDDDRALVIADAHQGRRAGPLRPRAAAGPVETGGATEPGQFVAGRSGRLRADHQYISAVGLLGQRDLRVDHIQQVFADHKGLSAGEAAQLVDEADARGEIPDGTYYVVTLVKAASETAVPVPDQFFDGADDRVFAFDGESGAYVQVRGPVRS